MAAFSQIVFATTAINVCHSVNAISRILDLSVSVHAAVACKYVTHRRVYFGRAIT